MANYTVSVDVRIYEPKDKHPVIFKTFEGLASVEKMELINDHDPRPLHYQFIRELPEQFEWQYMEEGPKLWKVAITKK